MHCESSQDHETDLWPLLNRRLTMPLHTPWTNRREPRERKRMLSAALCVATRRSLSAAVTTFAPYAIGKTSWLTTLTRRQARIAITRSARHERTFGST